MKPTKEKPRRANVGASGMANARAANGETKCNPLVVIVALILARCDMETARERLHGIALESDSTGDDPGIVAIVDASDLLDAAIVALAGTP